MLPRALLLEHGPPDERPQERPCHFPQVLPLRNRVGHARAESVIGADGKPSHRVSQQRPVSVRPERIELWRHRRAVGRRRDEATAAATTAATTTAERARDGPVDATGRTTHDGTNYTLRRPAAILAAVAPGDRTDHRADQPGQSEQAEMVGLEYDRVRNRIDDRVGQMHPLGSVKAVGPDGRLVNVGAIDLAVIVRIRIEQQDLYRLVKLRRAVIEAQI